MNSGSTRKGRYLQLNRRRPKRKLKDRVITVKAITEAGGEADAAAADAEACAEKIAEMEPGDRALAENIGEIVSSVAPELAPRTFYGMPAYGKDGKVVVFFQSAAKFKERYSTLGFQPTANLDDGNMWPTSFALVKIGKAEEKAIRELVKRAVS